VSRRPRASASGDRLQAGLLEHRVDAERRRVDRGHHRQQLANRQVLDQLAALEHRAEQSGVDRLARRVVEQRDAAGVGRQQSEQHVDRRRLAGTVGAEQRDGLATVNRDVDPAHRVY